MAKRPRKRRERAGRRRAADVSAAAPRSEAEVISDLHALCVRPGFIHAVAFLAFRDNTITYQGEVEPDDMAPLFSMSRIIRTEIHLLLGFAVQGPFSIELPEPAELDQMTVAAERLLEELHHTMLVAWGPIFPRDKEDVLEPNAGVLLREAIFYSSESAYPFQYKEFATPKYQADNSWLSEHKGFTVDDLVEVAVAISAVMRAHLTKAIDAIRRSTNEYITLLPCFMFELDEVAGAAKIDVEVCQLILESFCSYPNTNEQFVGFGDFNVINARPIVKLPDERMILVADYSLYEAIYEGPYYWLSSDKAYLPTAARNRGAFTEETAYRFLSRVFPAENVSKNVIIGPPDAPVGEIDVLVTYAERAIVLQAKSKRLTLEARRGDDGRLRDDFKKAVQDAYEQAVSCAEELLNGRHELHVGGRGMRRPKITRVYPICAVSDHYPALFFQTNQFLQLRERQNIAKPIITDIFGLDAVSEMLDSPLRFFHYLEARSEATVEFTASHELVLLGMHLGGGLYFNEKKTMVMLGDDIVTHLDIAMMARRTDFPGSKTPPGMLTALKGTLVGEMIRSLEKDKRPSWLSLGILLLSLSSDAARKC